MTRKTALGLALLMVASACGKDSTEPASTNRFDAPGFSANVSTMERVAGTPALVAWKSLGDHLGGSSNVSATSAAEPQAVRVVREVARLTGAVRGPELVPIVRPAVLGHTYVYDATAKRYVVDATRAGAPANGVRFVLYQTDETTGQPDPATEIGYADLIDEKASSPTSAGLRFRIVSNGVTNLEYAFELGGLVVSPTLAVTGYMSDGTDHVDFTLTVSGPAFGQGGPSRLDAKLDMPSKQFSVTATVTAEATDNGGTAEANVTAKGGSDIVEVHSKMTKDSVDATVTVNGKLLATATGDPQNPVIKGEGGRDLTADEMTALGNIVGFVDGVFKTFGDLLAPAGALLILALGLGV